MEALKANELRIGNLVGLEDSEWNGFNQFFEFMENSEVKSFLDDRNKCAIVKTIAEEVELMAYGVDLDFYSYKEIQPIPLTEDWLIRFGFKWSVFHQAIHKEGFDFDLNESSWGGYFLSTFKRGIHIGETIQHVHQLQNLYFALTGTELTLTE